MGVRTTPEYAPTLISVAAPNPAFPLQLQEKARPPLGRNTSHFSTVHGNRNCQTPSWVASPFLFSHTFLIANHMSVEGEDVFLVYLDGQKDALPRQSDVTIYIYTLVLTVAEVIHVKYS